MGLNLEYTEGQTPIDEDEKVGLKIKAISTMEELDQFEQQNIEEAISWCYGRSFQVEEVLTVEFVQSIHKRMFKNVWRWAGEFRTSEKNLGVSYYEKGRRG